MNTEITQALYGNVVEQQIITYVKTLQADDLRSMMESEADGPRGGNGEPGRGAGLSRA